MRAEITDPVVPHTWMVVPGGWACQQCNSGSVILITYRAGDWLPACLRQFAARRVLTQCVTL
eukprot:12053862-Prorocentrum_lima.AAC.1